jgi:hypothetical protein
VQFPPVLNGKFIKLGDAFDYTWLELINAQMAADFCTAIFARNREQCWSAATSVSIRLDFELLTGRCSTIRGISRVFTSKTNQPKMGVKKKWKLQLTEKDLTESSETSITGCDVI